MVSVHAILGINYFSIITYLFIYLGLQHAYNFPKHYGKYKEI